MCSTASSVRRMNWEDPELVLSHVKSFETSLWAIFKDRVLREESSGLKKVHQITITSVLPKNGVLCVLIAGTEKDKKLYGRRITKKDVEKLILSTGDTRLHITAIIERWFKVKGQTFISKSVSPGDRLLHFDFLEFNLKSKNNKFVKYTNFHSLWVTRAQFSNSIQLEDLVETVKKFRHPKPVRVQQRVVIDVLPPEASSYLQEEPNLTCVLFGAKTNLEPLLGPKVTFPTYASLPLVSAMSNRNIQHLVQPEEAIEKKESLPTDSLKKLASPEPVVRFPTPSRHLPPIPESENDDFN